MQCANFILSFLRNEAEYIGANVVPSESVKIPIGFNGSDFGVVVVERGVLSSDEMLRNGVA